MTLPEQQTVYKVTYAQWLEKLNKVKRENPEFYPFLRKEVQDYRNWICFVSSIDNLPEVPE